MSNKLKELRAKEGFTIIEVIIVLVIGAVIMLAVFLVVPQLQRTQRNSNRQNSARRVFTAAEQVNGNTGAYPVTVTVGTLTANCTGTLAASGTTCTPITSITGDVNTATGNTQYTVVTAYGSGTTLASTNEMFIRDVTTTAIGCANGKLKNGTDAIAGKFAVAVAIETASSATGDSFCVTN